MTPDIKRHIGQLAFAACAVAVLIFSARQNNPSAVANVGGEAKDSAQATTAAQQAVPLAHAVRVPILVYHNVRPTPARVMSAVDKQYEVTPGEFAAQMDYLADDGYAAIGFGELLAAQRGEKTLPDKPFIITLDDGRQSQYENALPALLKHGFTATFFVFSNAIGREGYLSWDELKDLQGKGMTIGSHTRYHQFLTKITDDAELTAELAGSKRTLEEGLGVPVQFLAYPFGFYDERVIDATKAAGYDAARGLKYRSTHEPGGEYEIGSFIATGDLKYFRTILATP